MRSPFDPARARVRLLDLVRERAFRDGLDVTLASGKKSTFYIDGKKVTLHPEGLYLIAMLMLRELEAWPQVTAVGGLTLGADPIVGALTVWSEIQGRGLSGFLVRKDAKGHGAAKRIEGPFHPGIPVAIVDDVITKGGSALNAFDAAREAGGVVKLVACVVDRCEGGAEEFAARGVPFVSVFTIREFLVQA